jgi:ATP-binding cassette subfamily B (MDR/TAP) protein 1
LIDLDGHDIKSLNLRWLRDQIAVVGQEPVLFNTTIFANIRCGLPTDNLSDRELNDRVIKAAIKAHAHGFISALPHGYQTIVGAKGLQLSGGQRQRISLARALISEAKILILDEASSALDAVSEQAVQAELDSTPRLRTTLVISHRLSAIRNADNIIVLAHGSVVEQGKHEELMSLKGVYARLVENQKLSEAVKEHVCLSDLEYGLSGTCKDLDSRQEENDPEEAFLSSDSGLDESERTMELRRLLPKAKKTQREKETAPPQRPSFRDYFRTVYRLNFPERFLLIIGAVMCAMTGFLWPL